MGKSKIEKINVNIGRLENFSKLSKEELLEMRQEALNNWDYKTVWYVTWEITRIELEENLRFQKTKRVWERYWALVYTTDSNSWIDIWHTIIDMRDKGLWNWISRISNKELEEWTMLNLEFNQIWDKWANYISTIKLNKWCTLNLFLNKIWAEWAKAIAKNLKLEEWVCLLLWNNNIWDEWAEAISKMELKEDVELELLGNEIRDKWAKAISKMELKNNVHLNLWENYIWDEWAEAISKMELKDWVVLNLRENDIWDRWAQAIMDNLELKDWVELNLAWNNISDKKIEELKAWAESYRIKWINCKVSFEEEYMN